MSSQIGDHKCFAREEKVLSYSVLWYKILSGLSNIILIGAALYYAFYEADKGDGPRHRFWQHQHTTMFEQSRLITSIYWYVIPLTYVIDAKMVTRSQVHCLYPSANLRLLSLVF